MNTSINEKFRTNYGFLKTKESFPQNEWWGIAGSGELTASGGQRERMKSSRINIKRYE